MLNSVDWTGKNGEKKNFASWPTETSIELYERCEDESGRVYYRWTMTMDGGYFYELLDDETVELYAPTPLSYTQVALFEYRTGGSEDSFYAIYALPLIKGYRLVHYYKKNVDDEEYYDEGEVTSLDKLKKQDCIDTIHAAIDCHLQHERYTVTREDVENGVEWWKDKRR